MNLRRWINDLLRVVGYRIVRAEADEAWNISRGRYDWLRQRQIATVLDIGAHTGQFAMFIRQIFPTAAIHAFEPLETCYPQLSTRAQTLQPMYCHKLALGNENAVRTIHHNAAPASSSLLPLGRRHREAFPTFTSLQDEAVQIRTLDSMTPDLSFSAPVLVKIDVQGYEMRVLEGMTKTLPLVDTMIVETSFVELYESQSLFDEVYRFLLARSFTYSGSFDRIVDPRNGALLQEDSVFFRTRGG